MSEKKSSLSGNVAIGVFFVAFVCVCVAFATPAWLVSDYRITGAQLDRLGLWSHCFRSLPNPPESDAPRRYFVGCRWVYDPFTAGYSDIRGFLLPGFMIATQFFFTLCFLFCVVSFVLVLIYIMCCLPEQKRYVQVIQVIGFLLSAAGTCGVLAVIIFACFGNADGWMPGHANNFFGYSFGLGVVGSVLALIASALFIVESLVQKKKGNSMRDSQMRFQLATQK